jgi:L-arabinonolactonase
MSDASRPDCIANGADRLGESPIWSVSQQALCWVDSRGPTVQRLDPANGKLQSWPAPSVVGSIGLRKSGGLIVALQTGFCGFDFNTGTFTPIVDPEANLPENRFNDGRCDRAGRFWAGTMNDTRRDPTGSLYRLDRDRRCHHIRDDIIVPNSLGWSPDNKTMYFADTYREHILAYEFSIAEGRISNPRLFADFAGKVGHPDGSTVDADGCVWNASYGGGRIVRYTPKGKIDRVVELPVSQPTSCCFGGARLDTLYITSATQRMTPEQRAQQPHAGGVFAFHPGVVGLPEPEYAG